MKRKSVATLSLQSLAQSREQLKVAIPVGKIVHSVRQLGRLHKELNLEAKANKEAIKVTSNFTADLANPLFIDLDLGKAKMDAPT